LESKDLQRAGLKVTHPRLTILQILEKHSDRHMSAEDVYRELMQVDEGKIGLATVYRVLTQFEAAGLVTRHNFDGGQAVFELDDGKHHDHIVCTTCGEVVEFFDEVIEERQRVISEEHGFRIHDHSLVLYGDCQRENCSGREATRR